MKTLLILIWLLACASAFARPQNPILGNVFQNDNRQTVDHSTYPWSTIGKLVSPNGAYCTATLVSRDLILTAAHCILSKGAFVEGTYYFYPAYKKGIAQYRSTVSQFTWGGNDPDAYRGIDWAIGRLAQPLGDQLGWLGTASVSLNALLTNKGYSIAGYSSDYQQGEVASLQSGCWFTGTTNFGAAMHNCSTSTGASGAAMFYFENGNPYIAAINVAEFRDGGGTSLKGIPYSDAQANLAVPSEAFIETLRKLSK